MNDTTRLLNALHCPASSTVDSRSMAALVFGPGADLVTLAEIANSGPPRERAAALLVLEAIGLPVMLDLDDDLTVRATAAARSVP